MKKEKLLTKSADILLESGFRQLASMNDGHGVNSTLFIREEDRFLVSAKKYAYQNLASFQLKQVDQAKREGLTLVFYEDRGESFTAFDPDFVAKEADSSYGKSRRAKTEWREIPLSRGADLIGYIYGIEEPDTLAGDNGTLDQFA